MRYECLGCAAVTERLQIHEPHGAVRGTGLLAQIVRFTR
jgi:hypothetical protein